MFVELILFLQLAVCHIIEHQNYYCHNQQQNPHTPRVMKSLGLNEADVELFCTDALFPKIKD